MLRYQYPKISNFLFRVGNRQYKNFYIKSWYQKLLWRFLKSIPTPHRCELLWCESQNCSSVSQFQNKLILLLISSRLKSVHLSTSCNIRAGRGAPYLLWPTRWKLSTNILSDTYSIMLISIFISFLPIITKINYVMPKESSLLLTEIWPCWVS